MVLSTNIYLPNGFQRLQGKSPHPLLRCGKAVNWEALADFGNTWKIVLFLGFSRVQSAQSKAQWAFLNPLQQVLGNSSRLSPPTTNFEEFPRGLLLCPSGFVVFNYTELREKQTPEFGSSTTFRVEYNEQPQFAGHNDQHYDKCMPRYCSGCRRQS